MKKIIINRYYRFIMFIEDICYALEELLNTHRKKIDDKYWDILD